MRPQCRLEEKSVPCSSSSLLSNCSVKVTRSGFILQVQWQSGPWQDYAIKERMVNFFRCELVSTNVTRLRPKTSCSRDQVVKSSFWKLQSCQMWSFSSSKVEVCGPGACPLVKGQTQCRREKKAVIQQVVHIIIISVLIFFTIVIVPSSSKCYALFINMFLLPTILALR